MVNFIGFFTPQAKRKKNIITYATHRARSMTTTPGNGDSPFPSRGGADSDVHEDSSSDGNSGDEGGEEDELAGGSSVSGDERVLGSADAEGGRGGVDYLEEEEEEGEEDVSAPATPISRAILADATEKANANMSVATAHGNSKTNARHDGTTGKENAIAVTAHAKTSTTTTASTTATAKANASRKRDHAAMLDTIVVNDRSHAQKNSQNADGTSRPQPGTSTSIPSISASEKAKEKEKEASDMEASYDPSTGAFGESGYYRLKRIISISTHGKGRGKGKKGRFCTVEWEGTDPATGRPWGLTTEPVEEMPEEMVEEFLRARGAGDGVGRKKRRRRV